MQTIIFSILIVLGVLLLFAAALTIFRAMLYGHVPANVETEEGIAVQGDLVAEHLASAVRLQTVSTGEHDKVNSTAFLKFHTSLEKMYPRIHATLQREVINQYSLLYVWAGRAADLDPILLCGHMDVVPADPVTLSEWTHPPFSGEVADGFVWGRGTLDMKGTVITVLEAVEGLIKHGYQPERTVYLAFGHDEEIGGLNGARCIADTLEQRGVRLSAVCDEGGAIMQEMLPGLAVPAALIGVAEKGFASLQLKVEGRPGHSSMPPRHTAIGLVARALARVEANPMPVRLSMIRLMFDEMGIFLPFANRLALANTWLLGGMLRKRLEASPTTNAMIRTTAAATMIHGGVKDNILPAQVDAVVNCRLLPGDTRASLLAHYRKAVNDEAVQIFLEEDTTWEPSPVSPVDSPVYATLARTVRQIFPDVIVAPFLVAGATDSRHYIKLTENIFRFSPDQMTAELLRTVHGIDERVSVVSLEKKVKFYAQLIKSWTTVVGTAE
jgi:carboxypeptidase PM20D1